MQKSNSLLTLRDDRAQGSHVLIWIVNVYTHWPYPIRPSGYILRVVQPPAKFLSVHCRKRELSRGGEKASPAKSPHRIDRAGLQMVVNHHHSASNWKSATSI